MAVKESTAGAQQMIENYLWMLLSSSIIHSPYLFDIIFVTSEVSTRHCIITCSSTTCRRMRIVIKIYMYICNFKKLIKRYLKREDTNSSYGEPKPQDTKRRILIPTLWPVSLLSNLTTQSLDTTTKTSSLTLSLFDYKLGWMGYSHPHL